MARDNENTRPVLAVPSAPTVQNERRRMNFDRFRTSSAASEPGRLRCRSQLCCLFCEEF